MKVLLALLCVVTFGYSMADLSQVEEKLNNLVAKYKQQANGNAEFSQWIEKAYYASRSSNLREKVRILRGFQEFDADRQALEDKITARIHEIESQLQNRALEKPCRTGYKAQMSVLKNAYKFSNSEKKRILNENSKKCNKKVDEDDDDDDHWWWWFS